VDEVKVEEVYITLTCQMFQTYESIQLKWTLEKMQSWTPKANGESGFSQWC